MKLTSKNKKQFQIKIWQYYAQHGREFAWRNVEEPYQIVVSEIMLQQTQTHRVLPKYLQFLELFPNFETLVQASLKDVLAAWQGLGYNRRAKFLFETAQKVVSQFSGTLPDDPELLKTFPGIGPNTAGSICAFAFNKPVTFIETNIRAVYLHEFFHGQADIADAQLLPLITETVDHDSPRHWYYALMDYGVYLKQTMPNPSRRSKHHSTQSKFEGSDRQIRGKIIRLLAAATSEDGLPQDELLQHIKDTPDRVLSIIEQLISEDFVVKNNEHIAIK